ncbi:nucleotide sugar dehydrogenase [bacterium SCSIO 12696]|nr:nucleotide sugar dehydrogenase [bacterium SCSIO 12696]
MDRPRLTSAKSLKKPAISIFGLGYVGAVSAACFSDLGHKVMGVDLDDAKVANMNIGKSVIVEDGLDDLLSQAHDKNLLAATKDAEQAILSTDVSFISVCTPSNEDGSCNLSYLKEATRQIGAALKKKTGYHLVVYRSTVPPQTTRRVMIPLLEEFSGKQCGKDFGVCYNPEFLRESTAIDDFHKPPKTVIGATDKRSADYAARLYQSVDQAPIRTTLEAAELVKCVDNTWHALKVCFGNEVGRLCQAVDVDSHEVMDIFLQDTKLNLSPYYLKPGFAYGGSCLPKEIRSMQHLARSVGVDLPVINQIDVSNSRHIRHAEQLIADLPGASVGVVGVSFKPGTDDLRESPAIALMQQLKERGREVLFYDPYLNFEQSAGVASDLGQSPKTTVCDHFFTLIRQSDVVVIAHNHPYAEEIARIARLYTHVVDLVRLPDTHAELANYSGVCW